VTRTESGLATAPALLLDRSHFLAMCRGTVLPRPTSPRSKCPVLRDKHRGKPRTSILIRAGPFSMPGCGPSSKSTFHDPTAILQPSCQAPLSWLRSTGSFQGRVAVGSTQATHRRPRKEPSVLVAVGDLPSSCRAMPLLCFRCQFPNLTNLVTLRSGVQSGVRRFRLLNSSRRIPRLNTECLTR
jgi:hypothetical protein